MTFYDEISRYNWDDITKKIYASKPADVERALAERGNVSLDDFAALVSPAAENYLEAMAQKSAEITRRRFGKVIQLYTPLYLSNYCSNRCIYCGFNCGNKIKRTVLSQEQIAIEAEAIRKHPFEHILLVTGEAPAKAGVEYLGESITTMKRYFSQTSIEVQPLDTDDYRYLMDKGLHSVYVYQETYNEKNYPLYHLAGKKRDYRYRLETPDRLGEAGVYKIGVANLIGLEEWRTDAFFTALHTRYLENKYWRTKCSISFPRLRPFVGEGFQPNYPANERQLLQLICAYRLLSEDVEISLSTRESPYFRDNVMTLGITTLSAGSKTAPGGYSDYDKNKELEQFSVNDDRSVDDVVRSVKAHGMEAVWKDWSLYMQSSQIGA
ncbi:MAG TPA: 2-iminoacetate synthase ThiH [Candidatus Avirikenella pullistercoris]|nr:2-iminoacetate synthase ThiH [Candidatus Avirikenella pullistercoris]